MASLKPKPRKPPPEEDLHWILTYSDMITLLMAFFLIIVSVSKVNVNAYEDIKASMAKGVGGRETDKPLDTLRKDLQKTLSGLSLDNVASIGRDADGIMVEIPSTVFFESGSASAKAESLSVAQGLAATLRDPRYKLFQIEVQGHTDDVPIATPQFPSNWELSSARASGVIRLLIANGIAPDRLKSTGMAEVSPKVPNRDPKGNPLPDNQEINRRITVRIYPR